MVNGVNQDAQDWRMAGWVGMAGFQMADGAELGGWRSARALPNGMRRKEDQDAIGGDVRPVAQ
jgi:hypothetical protein